ncbi:MAG: GTP cyclohydrolase I FolE [Rickettsiales bacterium]|nr:GTP cyclohydrolase I FolE [Rickettsiales bacterium]
MTDIKSNRPSRAEAEEAVKTLIRWAGDDYSREGLISTPKRVVKAYEEFFAGYNESPEEVLSTTFEEIHGYNDIVLLKNMRLESHCEHHMVPIIGKAHIAYLPNEKVVGISKIARLLDIYAKRLQTQETMTAQIVDTLQKVLNPKGIAVIIDAKHQCMTTRGIRKAGTSTVTSQFTGVFQDDISYQNRLYNLINIES